METWQLVLSACGALTTVFVAAGVRDRALMGMISGTREDWQKAILTAKDDCRVMLDAAANPLHERINRIRDEYVRQKDLDSHMGRYDKQFDDMRVEMRRNADATNKRLDEITKLLTEK